MGSAGQQRGPPCPHPQPLALSEAVLGASQQTPGVPAGHLCPLSPPEAARGPHVAVASPLSDHQPSCRPPNPSVLRPGCEGVGPPRPCLTFSSISLAVCLVVSRFSTRAVSPRKLPDAADSRASRESSSAFRTILNSFCDLVRFACRRGRDPGREISHSLASPVGGPLYSCDRAPGLGPGGTQQAWTNGSGVGPPERPGTPVSPREWLGPPRK